MNGTAILWGVLPAAVGLSALWGSMLAFQRVRTQGNLLATAFVFASVGSSLLILYRIFIRGAYPTYLPHLMIALSAIISIIQFVRARRR